MTVTVSGPGCPGIDALEREIETPAVQRHVETCPSCRAIVELLATRAFPHATSGFGSFGVGSATARGGGPVDPGGSLSGSLSFGDPGSSAVSLDEDCARWEPLIAACAAGGLALDVARGLGAHLEACPSCRAIASAVQGSPFPPREGLVEFHGSRRFEVVSRLGAGGMGIVYRVRDRERGSEVALKTLRTMSGSAVLRLKNEFRSLQGLLHPNLARLGELIGEDGQWFFTMELVDGVDLLRWVRPAALDVARLRAALAGLAVGLEALHAAGKIHRDIKPSNVLVTPAGRVVILDFGLVADLARDPEQADGRAVGTASYMPPEQAAGTVVGPAADWFSTGVLLYQALTGRLPFTGHPLERVVSLPPVEPPGALAPEAPPDLCDLAMALLAFDPAARPTDAQVLARLRVDIDRGGGRAASSSPPWQQPFVGRGEELATLLEAFDASQRGALAALLVRGESGIGKSALVRQFLADAPALQPGTVVLAGRCYENESVPFKAFDEAVDALARYLARLRSSEAARLLPAQGAALLARVFPVLKQVRAFDWEPAGPAEVLDPQEERRRVFGALRELLGLLARHRPLVLAIDDFQWADADSRALLAEILRPPDAPPLFLLLTERPPAAGPGAEEVLAAAALAGGRGLAGGREGGDERGPLPAAAAARAGLGVLELGRLPGTEARALAALLLSEAEHDGAAGVDPALSIAEEAGGHPLFIDELVRHRRAAATRSAELLPLGRSLEDALAARIARLEAAPRRLLEAVAVAGAPLEQDVVGRALLDDGAIADLEALARNAAELRAGNLVRLSGARGADTIEPYHDRVRQAVLAHLAPEGRRRQHHRLAAALETAPRADAEALAVHWREAGEPGKALAHATRAAGEAAGALAFDRAARLWRMALELDAAGPGDRRAAMRVKLGDALANAGRGAEAAEAYLAAAHGSAHVDEGEQLDLQRRAAEQLLRSGHIDEGTAALERVLASVGIRSARSPRQALASMLARRLQLRARGLAFRRRAEREIAARELERLDACWTAAIGLGFVDSIRGLHFQTLHLLLALDAGEPSRVARALALEGAYRAIDGARGLAETARILEDARGLAEEIGHPYALALAAASRGMAAFLGGRYPEALALCEGATATLRERCTGVAFELYNAGHYGLLALGYLGELRRLGAEAWRLRAEAQERGNLFSLTSLETRILPLVTLADGRPEQARALVRDAMGRWSKQQGWLLQHYYDLYSQAEIDLFLGGDAAFRRVEERWPRLARSQLLRIEHTRIEAIYLRGRAALGAAAIADRRRRLALAERQARLLDDERAAWAAPCASVLRAGVAAGRGDAALARAQLGEALAGFEALSMSLHAAASRRLLGELTPGPAGRSLVATADAWLLSQSISSHRAPLCQMVLGWGQDLGS